MTHLGRPRFTEAVLLYRGIAVSTVAVNVSSIDHRLRSREHLMPAAGFLAFEILFLTVAHLYGGPPWTLLGMLAFFAQIVADFRVAPLLRLVPSLAWLALFHATANRQLFFPYAMYLATHVALILATGSPVRAWVGGGGVVAAFLLIRLLQAAPPRVLAVESVVAMAILAAAMTIFTATGRRASVAVAVVFASSLLAYASLAL